MADASEGSSAAQGTHSSISSSLLDGLRCQSPDAWRRLVDLLGPVVYQWCDARGLQPTDAADVTQEVFQRVMASVRQFRRDRPGDTFRGWLWRITRNKIQDHYRQRKRLPRAFGGSDIQQLFQGLADPNGDEPSRSDTDCLIVRRALKAVRNDFSERAWEAFRRMVIDGQSSADIAADLGMTQEAVRRAKFRVLRRLREELDGLFPPQ